MNESQIPCLADILKGNLSANVAVQTTTQLERDFDAEIRTLERTIEDLITQKENIGQSLITQLLIPKNVSVPRLLTHIENKINSQNEIDSTQAQLKGLKAIKEAYFAKSETSV